MSVTIDEGTLRRMANDAAVYSLLRPWAIVMWAVLAATLVLSVFSIRDDGRSEGLVSFLPFASVGLMLFAVFVTVSGARRAVRAASPPGTVVWARVGDETLSIGSGRRTSEIPFREFEGVRVGRGAIILKIRDAAAITAVPREALSDEDIATLRTRITRAARR